jgi:DNA-binding SARP family transcriptional activator
LRQTLKQSCPEIQPIQFEPGGYRLNPGLKLWTDVAQFERHVKIGQRLESAGQLAQAMTEYSLAEALYQGDFLAEDLYEDWPIPYREYLRALYLDLANRLAAYDLQHGRYTTAIKLCQKILSKDNCHEEAHRRLMECYWAQGQRSLALRQYQACANFLQAELNLSPAPETQTLYEQMASGRMTFMLANPVAVSV